MLHYLTHLYHIDPDDIETITPVRQSPTYTRTFTTRIDVTRDESLEYDKANTSKIKIYTDGSGYKGKAGVAAILFKDGSPPVTLQYHLGPLACNTTYEAEAVGTSLRLELLKKVALPTATTLALDNQGVIQATAVYGQRQGHYIFDAIHEQTRQLAQRERARGATYSLQIYWVSGHSGADGNELVDKAAKAAVEGTSSQLTDLLKFIREFDGKIPASVSALKQLHTAQLRSRWVTTW